MHQLGETSLVYQGKDPLLTFRLRPRHLLSYAGSLPSTRSTVGRDHLIWEDNLLTLFSIHKVPFGYRADALKHVATQ